MGLDVYITRATHHFDGAQVPIVEGDWRAIIENDPDLSAPDAALPSYAVWVGSSRSKPQWIDWANGNLFTRNPSPGLLRKLFEVAEMLSAGLQDGGGRPYLRDAKGDVYLQPGAAALVSQEDVVEPPRAVPAATPTAASMQPSSAQDVATVERFADVIDQALLGPKPKNAEEALDHAAGPAADASFARNPEETLGTEPSPAPTGAFPFEVGQRVQTGWGQPATIVSIDPDADMGMGRIELRYRDGRVATTTCVSHGLRPATDQGSRGPI